MNCRILIVDDSPLLRSTARRAAMQVGVAAECIREAGDGRQALIALATEPADFVLLDVDMPVMDGYQFLEAKAADPALASVRVALITAEGSQKLLTRMAQLGIEHYLRKPFEPDDLRDLLRALFTTPR